jgi:hypothetical protein
MSELRHDERTLDEHEADAVHMMKGQGPRVGGPKEDDENMGRGSTLEDPVGAIIEGHAPASPLMTIL